MNGITPLERFFEWGWQKAIGRASAPVRAALERVLSAGDGGALTRDECRRLASATDEDLIALLACADRLRQQLVGDAVTYVVNRNINFTNVCFVGCKFCAFAVGPRESDAYFLAPEQVAAKAHEAWQRGATEVCIQGGLPRDLHPLYYRDLLRAVKTAVPGVHIHAFSPMEIAYGVQLTRMPLRDYLAMLRENGLDTLPGTAAEVLADEVRHVLSANKLSTAQWREIITTAHQLGIRSTSTLMYGHRETPEHWVDQLLMLRDMQSATGGFTEFVPLGFVYQNTLLFRQGLSRPGPTLEEHLKIHALGRVMLAGSIPHIQVSWVKLSRDVSQLCLRAGANDYSGTLMEENISRLAGATSGQCLSPAELQERILELGRIPAERNTTYTRIRRVPIAQSAAQEALPA